MVPEWGTPSGREGERRELNVKGRMGRPACLSELLGTLQACWDKAAAGPGLMRGDLFLCPLVPCGFFLGREQWAASGEMKESLVEVMAPVAAARAGC